jgi:hypothetical protein
MSFMRTALDRGRRDSIDAPEVRRAMLQKRLGRRWLVLGEHRLVGGGGECLIDFIFLHQDHGVVLVLADRGWYAVPELAVGVLRNLLLRHGFSLRFRGHLPVVCVSIDRAEAAGLPARLDAAFAQSAPIEITDPAWVEVLVAALAAENAPDTWQAAAPQPQTPAREAAPRNRLSLSVRDAVVAGAATGLFTAGLAAAPFLFSRTVPQLPAAAQAPVIATVSPSAFSPAPPAFEAPVAAVLPPAAVEALTPAVPSLGVTETSVTAVPAREHRQAPAQAAPPPAAPAALTPGVAPLIVILPPREPTHAVPSAVAEAPATAVASPIVLPQRKPAPPPRAPAHAAAGKECRPYTAGSAPPAPLRNEGGVACRTEDGRRRIVSHQPG